MALIFSKINLQGEKYNVEFLVSGHPTNTSQLKHWTVYEMYKRRNGECFVGNVEVYSYGEGIPYNATPEEVAYMYSRIERQPEFLLTRTRLIGKYPLNICGTQNAGRS